MKIAAIKINKIAPLGAWEEIKFEQAGSVVGGKTNSGCRIPTSKKHSGLFRVINQDQSTVACL